jgi:hypothetical protein
MRTRYGQLRNSVQHYETKVAKQAAQLERMNRPEAYGGDDDEEEEEDSPDPIELEITDEDLRREEEEVRELEKKKMALEERVNGMERDLGGLMR